MATSALIASTIAGTLNEKYNIRYELARYISFMYMGSTDRTNRAMVLHDFASKRHHLTGRQMHIDA
jgi:hypothetical protein